MGEGLGAASRVVQWCPPLAPTPTHAHARAPPLPRRSASTSQLILFLPDSSLRTQGASHVFFAGINVNVNFATWIASYPGPLSFVSVQFPDPNFKRRHRKRRIVQPQLAREITEALAPGGSLFLQVRAATLSMWASISMMGRDFDDFGREAHGSLLLLTGGTGTDLGRRHTGRMCCVVSPVRRVSAACPCRATSWTHLRT